LYSISIYRKYSRIENIHTRVIPQQPGERGFATKDGGREGRNHHREDWNMSLHEKLILHDCPYCGGAGLLEEEQGWCRYAMCLDCGAQTAQIEYKKPEEREAAAQSAANLWNFGKIMRSGIGD
jgi:hypothetical protein